MQEVDPNVSTDYRFFTSTFHSAIFFAANAIETVIVINNPSGMLATMIPTMNAMFVTMPYP
jgi:flagellar biosynthesis protein FliR